VSLCECGHRVSRHSLKGGCSACSCAEFSETKYSSVPMWTDEVIEAIRAAGFFVVEYSGRDVNSADPDELRGIIYRAYLKANSNSVAPRVISPVAPDLGSLPISSRRMESFRTITSHH